jgi:hypothetical protein
MNFKTFHKLKEVVFVRRNLTVVWNIQPRHGKTTAILTFKWPTFAYANAKQKTPLEVHFIYLGNKEIYWIFKSCYIISILFPTKCHLFDNFIFFCSNNTQVFINYELKFKYKPGHLTVNLGHSDFNCKWETQIKMHVKKYSYNKSIFHIPFVFK